LAAGFANVIATLSGCGTNPQYIVTSDAPDWLSVKPLPQNPDDGSSFAGLQVRAFANTHTYSRMGTIT